ncbi:MAG: hypothetical protein MUC41_10640 [Syntrophobacteraceae bacterium]|nr:hypothetical protein [Syntrophobacteraceae bacterium]
MSTKRLQQLYSIFDVDPETVQTRNSGNLWLDLHATECRDEPIKRATLEKHQRKDGEEDERHEDEGFLSASIRYATGTWISTAVAISIVVSSPNCAAVAGSAMVFMHQITTKAQGICSQNRMRTSVASSPFIAAFTNSAASAAFSPE